MGRSYHALLTQSPNVVHAKAMQPTVDFCCVLAESGSGATNGARCLTQLRYDALHLNAAEFAVLDRNDIFPRRLMGVLESIFGVEYQAEGEAFLA